MSETTAIEKPPAENLCLTCGLCCNGVIFADVRLQPGDSPARLRGLGLPLRQAVKRREPDVAEAAVGALLKFRQPCVAYADGRCCIYSERPQHCRAFECLVLKEVMAGTRTLAEAEGIVRRARQKAQEVRALLRALGETNEQLPLAARFRRLNRRSTVEPLAFRSADEFRRLTLAVHDLNLLLSESFYR